MRADMISVVIYALVRIIVVPFVNLLGASVDQLGVPSPPYRRSSSSLLVAREHTDGGVVAMASAQALDVVMNRCRSHPPSPTFDII